MFTKYYDNSIKAPDFTEGGTMCPPPGPQECKKTPDHIGLTHRQPNLKRALHPKIFNRGPITQTSEG